jgi:pimeloyl-ACP methyl ester carboxylesterase
MSARRAGWMLEPMYDTRPQRASDRRGVLIPAGGVTLPGALWVPPEPKALSLFASCRGWSGIAVEEAVLAHDLRERGFATLNFDLVCLGQGDDPRMIFELAQITDRLRAVVRWVAAQSDLIGLSVAFVATGTAAAAAVSAAAAGDDVPVFAIVAWNGRLDLVADQVRTLAVPTLLMIGSTDRSVARINATADASLPGEHRLQTLSGGGGSRQLTDAVADWLMVHVEAAGEPQALEPRGQPPRAGTRP